MNTPSFPDTRREAASTTMVLMIDAFSVEELPVENENNVQVHLVPAGGGTDPKWPVNAVSLILTEQQTRNLCLALRDFLKE